MARTGNFGGFAFDEEVFTGMMQEADYWTTPIIASGIVQQDSSIMDLIGEHGNVATIPIYKPIDANESGMEALNNDGETNNTPVEISGDKQTCMLIQRMKAFKAKDFTKELTGADPMTLIRNKIAGYYGQVWEKELMNIAQAVLAVAALSDHVLDLTKNTKTMVNDGLYKITELGDDFIRVDQELYKSTNLITKVEYPADVRAGVLELLKWDIKNRPKTGVKSETLSRYSVTYFDQDANNQVMGYPVALLGFLKPYIKARF